MFDTFASTAKAAGGKASFNCETDGKYRAWASDAGATLVVTLLVLICSAVVYSGVMSPSVRVSFSSFVDPLVFVSLVFIISG